MKNSIKFFVGGIVAAAIVFGAFAFTAKQNEGKEYLVVRVYEFAAGKKVLIQACDHTGTVEVKEESLEKGKAIFVDPNAGSTQKFAGVINQYAQKGYKLVSSSTAATGNVDDIYTGVYSTMIFEK